MNSSAAMPRLSVVVIAMDEEAVIGRCLESVQWADELILMDSGSTDRTVEIAHSLGAAVHVTPDWPGHATQRNRGIDLAAGEWVLMLDADEWVTPDLRDEIRSIVSGPTPHAAYRMPRLSSFCGRFVHHSGWWPDYISRLLKRGAARYAGGMVHDHLVAEGSVGTLRAHLMHESLVDLEDVLGKVNSYSTWGAQTLHGSGKRAGLGTAIGHGLWAFVRTYVMRAGFLDGRAGLMIAVYNAETTYYKYLKLMLLQERGR